ncbi:hypothetical protein HBA55_34605 [Pseudomaricurvus alkylphenolicus]|uniref:hypothetical protein n=1 Tax=Pseudomaricurvus alkylphenolicus TaxID=1306991 RepID=UPI001421F356|nr:hypothetical protein [Pseudomaricurvus alkylphenolicus]NIB44763.1 hypothetical protein [Pseudomaricurvus alkylphenolicus]
MKLFKLLTVSGKEYKLISEDARLNLFTPGRAVFTVQSEETIKGLVRFAFGYAPDNLQLWFVGYVETCTKIDDQQQRIFCRELTARLNQRIPLSLRNVTLSDVLATVGALTGLQFVTPDQLYANTAAPAFYSIGGGYHCMDALAKVFSIPQPMWQQQGNGQVFVGSWAHSHWQPRPLIMDNRWESEYGVANRAKVAAIPKLRPGVLVNNANTIVQVQMMDDQMRLTWSPDPWSDAHGR